jgi:catechol 2,3-dioxygenase-like lactoylglutathione lyase family enzyme
VTLQSICPILPSCDLDATRAFWGRLGFQDAGEDHDDYLILARDGVELHFFLWPAHDPDQCYAGAYLRVSDPATLDAEWGASDLPTSGIPRLIRVEDKPWGMRELAVIDPDGNLIRVGAPL